MNIIMMTNTYLPHVGGVARSVQTFADHYRELGHRVLIVAPQFPHQAEREAHVLRVPAIQRFNGSDFSVRLPSLGLLGEAIGRFRPDIIHSHHPFLLGDTALRLAARFGVPLITTHHTLYEKYTHYVPGNQPLLQWFVIRLATEYANLCQQVIAPSETIRDLLEHRGVVTPVAVVPTGIDIARFARGSSQTPRQTLGIRPDHWVVGHVGRLAAEKNLHYLLYAVTRFLQQHANAHLLLVGDGPLRRSLQQQAETTLPPSRVHLVGSLTGQPLIDAYHAMNVFAFASQSETQGLVLAEAMAAGLPVVALDGPGVREVVQDQHNGRLLPAHAASDTFAEALGQVCRLSGAQQTRWKAAALTTAREFDSLTCARRAIGLYEQVLDRWSAADLPEADQWSQVLRRVEAEWNLWAARAEAAMEAISHRLPTRRA